MGSQWRRCVGEHENVTICRSVCKMLEIGIFWEFSKIFFSTNCRDPMYFSSFIMRGGLYLQPAVTLIKLWRWRVKLRRCKNATKRKILTFQLFYLHAPTRSHTFFTWNWWRALSSFMWSCLFHGILLAHQVMRLWKQHEGAVHQVFRSI